MIRFATLAISALFLISIVNAEASPAPWDWSKYTGTSQWRVTVTEDQSDCQGPVLTNDYDVPVDFSGSTATMGDVGHGPATGTFISNNILHIAGRRVSDPPGSSTLSDYDVYFTTDCSAFAARYTWEYSGSDGSCSGSTRLAGSSAEGCPLLPGTCRSGLDCNTTSSCVNGLCVPTQTQGVCTSDSDCNSGKACVNGACVVGSPPAPPPTPLAVQLVSARQDLDNDLLLRQREAQLMEEVERSYGWFPPDSAEEGYAKIVRENNPRQMAIVHDEIDKAEAGIETRYQAILSTDPGNVQANWDMAELRKSQGNYDEYKAYMDKALGKISDIQAQTIRTGVQSGLGLQSAPTPDTSKVVQHVGNEVKELKSIGGVDVSTLTSDQRNRLMVGLVAMSLFDKNGDVLSALDIKFK